MFLLYFKNSAFVQILFWLLCVILFFSLNFSLIEKVPILSYYVAQRTFLKDSFKHVRQCNVLIRKFTSYEPKHLFTTIYGLCGLQ